MKVQIQGIMFPTFPKGVNYYNKGDSKEDNRTSLQSWDVWVEVEDTLKAFSHRNQVHCLSNFLF